MNEREILKRLAWHRGFCLGFFTVGVLSVGFGVPSMLLHYGTTPEGCFNAFVMSFSGIGCFLGACVNAFDWGEESKALDQASKTTEQGQ